MNSIRTYVSITLVMVATCVVQASSVSAATLSLSPVGGSSSYSVGQIFSVNVTVSTAPGESMNAVSGIVSFPTNTLQLVSMDKGGSIIDFWIAEPTLSNATGQAQFEGGSYNPGFSGTQGKVITMLFRAKTAGTADISFSDASVLANDGQGTNILTQAQPVRLAIAAATTVDVPTPAAGSPIAVRSATHPDQNAWYGSRTVALAWDVPRGVTALRVGYDQDPRSTPTQTHPLDIPEKVIELTDGVWYFHIQAREAQGWGPVGHYKIQIDTTVVNPPVFDRFPALLTEGDVLLVSGAAAKNSTVKLFLKGADGYRHEQTTRTGDDGRFQAVWDDELDTGTYGLTAEVSTARGITSLRSAERAIMVQPTAFMRATKPALDYAMMFMALAGIVIICVLWTWYLVHGFRRFRKKVRADIKKTNQLIHTEFKKILDRARSSRALTREESRMMDMISEIEKEVERDVRDIGN